MPEPARPKIYHIVHVDRLPSIVADGNLWCDAIVAHRGASGTMIGISKIKQRRRTKSLPSYPELCVGDCVPFYFCPRSAMLFPIFTRNNPDLTYKGGQEPIIHLEADLRDVVSWANKNEQRWVFTKTSAGSSYFDDYSDLAELDKVDWDAVRTKRWSGDGIPKEVMDNKQAEFLVERCFPWELVSRIGVRTWHVRTQTQKALEKSTHLPRIEILPSWYY